MGNVWYRRAQQVIHQADMDMPYGVSAEERRKRIKDAYPFGERANTPYKAWLRAQREYLGKHSALKPKGTTPMEDFINAQEDTHD